MPSDPEVISAVPVPFGSDGSVDLDTFTAMLTRIEPHVQGAFVAGTTGEFPALEPGERTELLRRAVEVLGADRVVAHVGAPSVRQVLRLAESAAELGVDRLACLTPYYLPCDPEQVHDFYAAVAAGTLGSRLYVYVFPERTGIEVTPTELGELTRIEGVVGAKLSGSPNAVFEEHVARCAPATAVYSGDDASFPRVRAAGGVGVVSGVSAAFPELFSALTAALRDGDDRSVDEAQAAVVRAVGLAGPSITRLKYALATRHGETWGTRMPLPEVPPAVRGQIDDLVAQV